MADAPAPTATPRLVLASSSPRRAELLARLGLSPEIRPADVDETPLDGEDPVALVTRLAASKAASVARARGNDSDADAEVVLAADTVVVLGGRILGKPRDGADAAAMLEALSGRTHAVVTGLAIHHGSRELTDVVTTDVTFRSLTATEVAWYLGTEEPLDKAGGYGLQGAGAVLVARVDGSDTNVIGLPLAETVALLRRVGVDVLVP